MKLPNLALPVRRKGTGNAITTSIQANDSCSTCKNNCYKELNGTGAIGLCLSLCDQNECA